MTRFMITTSAVALALAAGPALAQTGDKDPQYGERDNEYRVRINADGMTDTIDVTPDHPYDYAEWTPGGNLVAYDVDGDGWVAYSLGEEEYLVRDEDGDGYVLRTDVSARSDTPVEVITVEYDARPLEPLTGEYDRAFLVDRSTGARFDATDVDISEGGRETLIAREGDLVVETDRGTFVVEDGETYTVSREEVSEAWTAPVSYTFVNPVSAMEARAAYQAEAETKPSNDWVAAPMLNVFTAMDMNDDMQVSYDEWGNWQADEGFHADRFGEFDSNGDRTLGWEEYRSSVYRMYNVDAGL